MNPPVRYCAGLCWIVRSPSGVNFVRTNPTLLKMRGRRGFGGLNAPRDVLFGGGKAGRTYSRVLWFPAAAHFSWARVFVRAAFVAARWLAALFGEDRLVRRELALTCPAAIL